MIADNIERIKQELPSDVMLVAVSKFHPSAAVREAYACGQRVFAESRPQELQQKALELGGRFPSSPEGPCPEIEWHFIGHLQTNKLKMVLPYASLVQSIDSLHLLKAVSDWGVSNGRVIDVLLEVHIGAEETKQGFHEEEVVDLLFDSEKYPGVRFCGLMGMASHTDDPGTIHADFARIDGLMAYLVDLFPELASFRQLSIGMSGDWKIALQHGATIVRIGTAIFGQRDYGTR
ncbi:MAG: YggS family pyridoxal phosphate-dependent enzyme [Bacteroidales bacterium]|nr:YggS family pyridoxal phosphate-dependent enzyme [Bacteroidales bacterium]MDY3782827.1 YggS family pyridoxal phosphate-dependent enzyme [Candidatus Cryptobacteroides sp.]